MVTKQLHDPCGGHLGLDFANSIDRPVDREPEETLLEYGDLLLWSVQAGSLTGRRSKALARSARGDPRGAARVLRRAVKLREAIFATFSALVQRTGDVKLGDLNDEISRALRHARIETNAEGFEWAWAREVDALDEPLWPIARAVAELLVSPERAMVKQCGSATCLWLFLDSTRNHRRRWCEMKTCGNREKVRQHRRRKASGG